MPQSKIGICNLALAMVGAESIRSFDDSNNRSRLCEVFFDHVRDFLLGRYDWGFARKLAILSELDPDDMGIVVPTGYRLFTVPSDCRVIRGIEPRGSDKKWEMLGTKFITNEPGDMKVYYTVQEVNTAAYTDGFVELLALGLAAKIAGPLAPDPSIIKSVKMDFQIALADGMEADANIGNSYIDYDDDQENDSFVDPDIR